jgi:hypothetical protein
MLMAARGEQRISGDRIVERHQRRVQDRVRRADAAPPRVERKPLCGGAQTCVVYRLVDLERLQLGRTGLSKAGPAPMHHVLSMSKRW